MILDTEQAVAIPTKPPTAVEVPAGPLLLADLGLVATLAGHRVRWGAVGRFSLADLVRRSERVRLSGRGGAAFPFARKLALAGGARRCRIVVNAAEGEPASAKDAALLTHAPHLVLDGAAAAAGALGAHGVDIVLPGDRPDVVTAVSRALAERHAAGERLTWSSRIAEPRFVAGQETAVLQAIAGAPGLPVTAWAPAAQPDGHGRATLLSNAETWAHLAAALSRGGEYGTYGLPDEPGTTLLTLRDQRGTDAGLSHARVCEVEMGTPWAALVPAVRAGGPRAVLLGGYHGSWVRPESLRRLSVSRVDLAAIDATLGAGVVFAVDRCPVTATAAIVDYLAGQSAGRCGPCRNGLPALAVAMHQLAAGSGGADSVAGELDGLADLVAGRGACKHPDGTVRLIRSLSTAFAGEFYAHRSGGCRW